MDSFLFFFCRTCICEKLAEHIHPPAEQISPHSEETFVEIVEPCDIASTVTLARHKLSHRPELLNSVAQSDNVFYLPHTSTAMRVGQTTFAIDLTESLHHPPPTPDHSAKQNKISIRLFKASTDDKRRFNKYGIISSQTTKKLAPTNKKTKKQKTENRGCGSCAVSNSR